MTRSLLIGQHSFFFPYGSLLSYFDALQTPNHRDFFVSVGCSAGAGVAWGNELFRAMMNTDENCAIICSAVKDHGSRGEECNMVTNVTVFVSVLRACIGNVRRARDRAGETCEGVHIQK